MAGLKVQVASSVPSNAILTFAVGFNYGGSNTLKKSTYTESTHFQYWRFVGVKFYLNKTATERKAIIDALYNAYNNGDYAMPIFLDDTNKYIPKKIRFTAGTDNTSKTNGVVNGPGGIASTDPNVNYLSTPVTNLEVTIPSTITDELLIPFYFTCYYNYFIAGTHTSASCYMYYKIETLDSNNNLISIGSLKSTDGTPDNNYLTAYPVSFSITNQ